MKQRTLRQKPHGHRYQLGIYSIEPNVYQWLFERAKKQDKTVSEVAREIITAVFEQGVCENE